MTRCIFVARRVQHRIQYEKGVRRAGRLRGYDLLGLDAYGLDFSDSYFRQSDLRSIDFRKALLEGFSINAAMISGAYFPAELSASEIELSLLHGIRMRYRSKK